MMSRAFPFVCKLSRPGGSTRRPEHVIRTERLATNMREMVTPMNLPIALPERIPLANASSRPSSYAGFRQFASFAAKSRPAMARIWPLFRYESYRSDV